MKIFISSCAPPYLDKVKFYVNSFFGNAEVVALERLLAGDLHCDLLILVSKNKIEPDVSVELLKSFCTNCCLFSDFASGQFDYSFGLDDLKNSIIELKTRLLFDQKKESQLILGNSLFDLEKRLLIKRQKSIFLRHKEFSLLKFLIKNRGKVFSKEDLLYQVWDINAIVSTNTVEVHVSKLRKMFKKLGIKKPCIKTISQGGYLFE